MCVAAREPTSEEALKQLVCFIGELEAGWERDHLEWAPALLDILRGFTEEASKPRPDFQRLGVFRGQALAYFKSHRFLKGIDFVPRDIDIVCDCYGNREA